MSLNNPSEGWQNSQAYVSSGLPYVLTTTGTGSIDFENVSKFLTIAASGSDVSLYFQADTSYDRKFVILSGQTVTLDLRVTKVFFETAGTISLLAGLTLIPVRFAPILSSSNWTGI